MEDFPLMEFVKTSLNCCEQNSQGCLHHHWDLKMLFKYAWWNGGHSGEHRISILLIELSINLVCLPTKKPSKSSAEEIERNAIELCACWLLFVEQKLLVLCQQIIQLSSTITYNSSLRSCQVFVLTVEELSQVQRRTQQKSQVQQSGFAASWKWWRQTS